jgi:integrase
VKREVNGEIVDVPLRETSIATNLRNLRVFLRWAHNQGHIQKLPTFPKYKGTRSRGRGLNLEEFERLLQAAKDMRPNDYPQWERFLKAIWHSGLRLGEALQLSWDEDSGFRLDLSQRIGRFQIQSASQKSRRTQEAPITPTFEAWMRETPVAERKGLVLPLVNPDGKPYSRQNVAKFIAAFGKKACILVDRELNKTATCHDLRKSFGSRLAPQLPSMEVLASLLRHASTQTTEQYYRHRSVERTANLLQQFCPANESVGLSNQISTSDESSTTQEPAETLGK